MLILKGEKPRNHHRLKKGRKEHKAETTSRRKKYKRLQLEFKLYFTVEHYNCNAVNKFNGHNYLFYCHNKN